MTGGDFLVVVAPAARMANRTSATPRAFVAPVAATGVHLRARAYGIVPMVALGAPPTFAMLMWETGDPAADCEVLEFAAPMLVAGPVTTNHDRQAVTAKPEQKPSGRIA